MKSILALLACVVVVFLAAFAGSLGMGRGPGEWYASLAKPSWMPPGWLFGPVWTALYAMMAVALWLVWQRQGALLSLATALFLAQLVLNAAWTWLFFGFRMPGWALVEIAILWCAILATTVAFGRVRPLAGLLLVPYLLWVGFASALNFALWRMNPV